jgi:hypothetical protein
MLIYVALNRRPDCAWWNGKDVEGSGHNLCRIFIITELTRGIDNKFSVFNGTISAYEVIFE